MSSSSSESELNIKLGLTQLDLIVMNMFYKEIKMAQLPSYTEYLASNRTERSRIRQQYKAAGLPLPHAGFGRVHTYKDTHYPKEHSAHNKRPERWHFKDVELREQHFAYNKMKAQASFRKEEWALSLEDYFDSWRGSWSMRGRGGTDLVMTRIDPEMPWCRGNVEIIVRHEHICRVAALRKGIPTKCR